MNGDRFYRIARWIVILLNDRDIFAGWRDIAAGNTARRIFRATLQERRHE